MFYTSIVVVCHVFTRVQWSCVMFVHDEYHVVHD